MKKLALLLMLLVPTVAMADDWRFTWTPNESNTEGYHLYMDTWDNHIATIEHPTSEYTMEQLDDGRKHKFWIVAYNGTEESGPSDYAYSYPETVMSVGGFTITVVPND